MNFYVEKTWTSQEAVDRLLKHQRPTCVLCWSRGKPKMEAHCLNRQGVTGELWELVIACHGDQSVLTFEVTSGLVIGWPTEVCWKEMSRYGDVSTGARRERLRT